MGRGAWCVLVLVMMLGGSLRAEAQRGNSPLGGACFQVLNCEATLDTCLMQSERPGGVPLWSGGYCTHTCAGAGDCPSGSACVRTSEGGHCLKQCAKGRDADCRAQYVCEGTSSGDNVCFPACGNDADCASGTTCRVCDGRCIPRGRAGALVGDPCDANEQCGTGQVCQRVNGGSQGFCTQPCGSDLCYGSCPGGSTCQKVGADALSICVRSCSGDSCGAAFQCAPFPGGAGGCLPPCRAQADCPSGSTCGSNGQCQGIGSVDPGCPLCGGPPDAGYTPPRPDAGTGTGEGVGVSCGCQGAAVNAPGFLGALVLFLVAARRRRCPRP